jgi:hypothetical protein
VFDIRERHHQLLAEALWMAEHDDPDNARRARMMALEYSFLWR